MNDVEAYLPQRVNEGSFLTAFTLNELLSRVDRQRMVLPICSLGTPVRELSQLADLVLPPLYHEALTEGLKSSLLDRIRECFPFYQGTRQREQFQGEFEIVELPRRSTPAEGDPESLLAFSVDTAVEEHGPHLPLMTDTIQSYGVLKQLCDEFKSVRLAPPVEYGQLTWGLPFGLSIDLTAPLLTDYVAGYLNALIRWQQPRAVYVVDVHGSIVHRNAIQEGLRRSECQAWKFRWLHEPLVEFAGERGDQHAGGVETALVHHLNHQLVDDRWWPERSTEIADGQMSMLEAVQLSSDLPKFIEVVQSKGYNGIVGAIENFDHVDASLMMQRMLDMAREDLQSLL